MALTGRFINDQNLGLNFNGGGTVGGNMNAGKVQKKGGLGGRKPLGDLSNAGTGNRSLNQAPKKQISRKFPLINEEMESSKFKGKKTSTSKTRKALSDISNKDQLSIAPEAPKNKTTTKLSVLADDSIDFEAIAEEGFLHNHKECIKQQERASAMDMDYFLETLGLHKNKDYSNMLSSGRISPVSRILEPESPPRFLKDEEDCSFSPREDYMSSRLDSPTQFWTPGSPELNMDWTNMDLNFSLVESPKR